MRYFNNRSQLSRMEFGTRLISTYFLLFMLLATVFSIYMGFERTGLNTADAAAYYRGDAERMMFPKEATELIETTHFHLYMTPLIYMTTGHLFLLSAWSRKWKVSLISAGFVYVLLDIAKPWLIRYGAPGFGVLAPINSSLLALTMLLFIVIPIYEMWFLKENRATEVQ